MRASFRILTSLLLLAVTLSACKSNKEEDTFREEFSVSNDLGIYQDGKQTFVFLKKFHQYYCNPKENLVRIIDQEGVYDLTVKFSAMPSSAGGVSGTVSGNMGLTGFSFSELKILKIDSRTVWLWSDKEKAGFILPSAGLQTTKAN